MTVDYTHILSFDSIICGRKRSDSSPSVVYRVKIYTLHRYPIDFALDYCIAAAPDPAWDYMCANESTMNNFSILYYNVIGCEYLSLVVIDVS